MLPSASLRYSALCRLRGYGEGAHDTALRELDLKAGLARRLRVFQCRLRCLAEGRRIRCMALQLTLCLVSTPGNRTDTAQGNTNMFDPVAAHLDDDRCRGKRELVRSRVAQLQVVRSSTRNRSGQRDADNQVAGGQDVLTVRSRARLQIEL